MLSTERSRALAILEIDLDGFTDELYAKLGAMDARFERLILTAISETVKLEARIMALTQAQEERFGLISGALAELGTEIGTVLTEAQATQASLSAAVASLSETVATLEAQIGNMTTADETEDAAFQETIAALQATIASLESALAQNEADVVSALDSVVAGIAAIDEGVGGDAPVVVEA